MFSLNALSHAAQRERAANLLREAERERLYIALTKPTGRRPALAPAANTRWREALDRLRWPKLGRRSAAPAAN